MPIHRTIKNVVHNYTYAEVKVREATSNDPWGPPSNLMAEIAELTRNPLSYNETMSMIWRRLNDHGKNWRHVYKALVLLDHLVHHGSERVTRDCRNNIVAVRTLADFQHVDENGRDNGLAVREKARKLAILLGDDERLRGERIRAHETKDRFGADSYGATIREEFTEPMSRQSDQLQKSSTRRHSPPLHSATSREVSHRSSRSSKDMDAAVPTSSGEEELQLQLALAMSKEEHEEEVKRQKADELKLQLAIEESKKTARVGSTYSEPKTKKTASSSVASVTSSHAPSSSLLDAPLDKMIVDPWAPPARPAATSAWNDQMDTVTTGQPDIWLARRSPSPVIYAEIQRDVPTTLAPWEEVEAKFKSNGVTASSRAVRPQNQAKVDSDEFVLLSKQLHKNLTASSASPSPPVTPDASASNGDAIDLLGMTEDLTTEDKKLEAPGKKVTPEEFLGPNAKLVDFDDLVSKPTPASAVNPFAMTIGKPSAAANPFVARAKEEEQSRRVPIGQLQSSGSAGVSTAQTTVWPTLAVVYSPQPVPPQPVPPQHGYNPFL